MDEQQAHTPEQDDDVDPRSDVMAPITVTVVEQLDRFWASHSPEQLAGLLQLWGFRRANKYAPEGTTLIVQIGDGRVTVDVGKRIEVVEPPEHGTGAYL